MNFKKNNNIIFILFTLSIMLFTNACVETVIAAGATSAVMAVRKKSFSNTRSDVLISAEIVAALLKNKLKEPNNMIGVNVNEGRVMLTGVVRDEDKSDLAVSLCWKVKGVKEVIDEIQIKKEEVGTKDLGTAIIDSAITAEIKTRLIFNKEISSINFQVTTVNHIAYVIGVAKNNNESRLVIQTISKVAGVKKVVSHIILASDPRRNKQDSE
jgi:osmotically-inducible protein OsmY